MMYNYFVDKNQKTEKWLGMFFIILIAILGAYIIKKALESKITPSNTSPENTEAAPSKTNPLADSDNDGLPDWEEELRGTNPQSPDTDDDGTSDKEEARLGRNPLAAGPNDTVKDEYVSKIKPVDNFLQNKSQNIPANNVPEEKPAQVIKTDTLKKFGNNLAAVIKKYAGNMADDGKTFSEAAKSPNEETLKKILEIGFRYKNLAGELEKMETPEKAAEIIKNFRINLVNLSASTENLARIGADGKIPIENFQKYGENAMESNKSVIEIMKFFKNEGVQFSQNEDGYIFRLP